MKFRHEIMFILVFLSQEACYAKDFGVLGQVWEIEEKDAVEEIKEKLSTMDKKGILDEHNQVIKERINNNINNPKSLGLPTATVDRVFFYDPSIIISEDLKDHRGAVFYKKGTRINPLEIITLSYNLIFFDAEKKVQLDYALNSYDLSVAKPKLILTGGSPIQMEHDFGLDIYFDQKGELIRQLGIKAVPAVVEQEGLMLKITEVRLDQ